MADILIVDGYNIINAWSELDQLKRGSLDDARQKLVDILSSYASFKGWVLIVVFDAHSTKGKQRWLEVAANIQVVFTAKGETADSVIERLAYEMQGQHRVWVATSDRDEQYFVLGAGANRMSARELLLDVKQTATKMNREFSSLPSLQKKNALGEQLDPSVAKKLEDLRRGR